ncbi:MAG TPA: hypothetical protein VMJ35_04960 [Dongiaceae bacterium]|nr:hypothetical protein [Dongiaceae bacterium]
MPSPPQPLAKSLAVKSLQLAVRCWPADSRHWGQALLAEIYGIADPVEAIFWALGGVTVFLRSFLSHLLAILKLPPGRTNAPLSVRPGSGGPVFPRHSRLLTALVLLAFIVFCFLPSTREATSIVASSWNGFDATARDSRVMDKLAARADRQKDAGMMAFAAIAHPDPDRASVLADRAVGIDPSLIWIYASRFRRPDDTTTNKEWLSRLRSSDPDNAFVYLLAAAGFVDPQVRSWMETAYRENDNLATTALRKSQWAKYMSLAFQAPRYDSYLNRHLDLTREGWRRAPEVPATLVAYSVWSHHIPNLLQIRSYARWRLRDARAAATAGHPSDSQAIVNEVVDFGRTMTKGSETDIERLVGLEITRLGLEETSSLYSQNGRQRDADAAMAELRKVKARSDKLAGGDRHAIDQTVEDFRRKADRVQASAIATLFVVFLTSFALLWLELSSRFSWPAARSLRRLACFISDWGPVVLPFMATAFLLSFRPFASALDRYRAANSSNAQEFFNWQLWALASRNPFQRLVEPSVQPTLWLLLILALSALASYFLVHGLWKQKNRGLAQ